MSVIQRLNFAENNINHSEFLWKYQSGKKMSYCYLNNKLAIAIKTVYERSNRKSIPSLIYHFSKYFALFMINNLTNLYIPNININYHCTDNFCIKFYWKCLSQKLNSNNTLSSKWFDYKWINKLIRQTKQ